MNLREGFLVIVISYIIQINVDYLSDSVVICKICILTAIKLLFSIMLSKIRT